MRRLLTRSALGAVLIALAACSGGGGGGTGTSVTPTPSPTPTPLPTATATGGPAPTATATQTPTNYNVLPCLQQQIPGYGGITVAQMLQPDTVKVYPGQTLGYPNGRRPSDAVVDITLAMAFVDLTQRPLGILAAVPINPGGNDVPYPTDFPYFAPAQGTPPASDTSGTTFDFRTEDDAAFTRVDRMGLAAIATVLIGSPLKNAFNDASPAEDLRGDFTPDEIEQLRRLTVGLADDLLLRGVAICARPQ